MWCVEQEPFRHLPSTELRRLLDGLAAAGVDRRDLCNSIDVSIDELFEREYRVPAKVLLSLLNRAERLSGNPLIGLRAAESTDLNDVTAAVMAAQPNIQASLNAFCRFQYLLFGAEPVTLRADESRIRILFSRGNSPAEIRQLSEYYFRTLCLELIRLGGSGLRPIEVRFTHGDAGIPANYERAFDCRVTFYASQPAILLRRDRTGAALETSNPFVAAQVEQLAEAELAALRSDSLIERATIAIQALIASGTQVSCRVAARHLGLSARTFQRQLAARGRTFVALRDEVREEMAATLLAHHGTRAGSHSMARVALALGYSESSPFYRAIKRWTGLPAGAYRQHCKREMEPAPLMETRG